MLSFVLVLAAVEGGVEFDPEDHVGLRGVDGGDGRVVSFNGNEVCLQTGCEEGAVG
jgi:hypothetical protein